jgi:membrane protease YdiL (CAAX protease family)
MDTPLRLPLPSASSLAQPPLTPAKRYRRLTPPARVGLYLAACVGASLLWCLVLLAALRPGWDIFTFPDRYPLASGAYLAGTYVILIGGALWSWRRLQGDTLRGLGLVSDRPIAHLAAGLAIGLGSLGALFAFEVAMGWLQWNPAAWQATSVALLATNALTALFFGFSEELLFRGFIFRTLRRGWALPFAMVGSAWLYAQVHFLKVGMTWHTVAMPFAGLFLAGLVLAWAAHRTRAIWLSVGLHTAWVYLFFLADRQKLLTYPIEHNWLTGGGYPLAGWAAIGMLALLGLGLTWAWRPAPISR